MKADAGEPRTRTQTSNMHNTETTRKIQIHPFASRYGATTMYTLFSIGAQSMEKRGKGPNGTRRKFLGSCRAWEQSKVVTIAVQNQLLGDIDVTTTEHIEYLGTCADKFWRRFWAACIGTLTMQNNILKTCTRDEKPILGHHAPHPNPTSQP